MREGMAMEIGAGVEYEDMTESDDDDEGGDDGDNSWGGGDLMFGEGNDGFEMDIPSSSSSSSHVSNFRRKSK